MALAEDIRERVLGYLAGNTTLTELEDWLVEQSWGAHLSDPEAADLAYELKLLIAEHMSGHRSELDLKRAFVPFVQGAWVKSRTVEPTETKPPPPRPLVLKAVAS